MDLVHNNDAHKYIIGVMALQGAVEEHMHSIRKLGATAIEVQKEIFCISLKFLLARIYHIFHY